MAEHHLRRASTECLTERAFYEIIYERLLSMIVSSRLRARPFEVCQPGILPENSFPHPNFI